MSGYDEVVGHRSWEVGCYLSKWIWHYVKESIQNIDEDWRSLFQGEIDLLLLVGSLILNYNFLLLFYTIDNYSNFLKPESLLSAVVKSRSHPYLFTNVILFNMRKSMDVARLTIVSNWLVYSHRRIWRLPTNSNPRNWPSICCCWTLMKHFTTNISGGKIIITSRPVRSKWSNADSVNCARNYNLMMEKSRFTMPFHWLPENQCQNPKITFATLD